jgi:ketosteroid isomerase-like protein
MMQDMNAFVAAWEAAWNRHDIEAVLAHFADDAVFASPIAAKLLPESQGRVAGKAAIRAYWQKGLALNPALRFKVARTFAGVDIVVIEFLNEKGQTRAEVLKFRDGQVVEGYGTDQISAVI